MDPWAVRKYVCVCVIEYEINNYYYLQIISDSVLYTHAVPIMVVLTDVRCNWQKKVRYQNKQTNQ